MLIWPRRLYYRLPAELRQRILIYRYSRRWMRTGVVFIHIPKAAGVSICNALYGGAMGHPRVVDVLEYGSAELKALPRFAVTRNPWDRLVSAYRFSRRGAGVGGRRPAWVWQPEQYQVPEFDTFERFVKEWLFLKDVSELDPIFQPQSKFVMDANGKVAVDHVGRLENLGPTYEFLAQEMAAVPSFSDANRSGPRVDYRTFYTPELKKLVGRIYAQDVETFGYSFSD